MQACFTNSHEDRILHDFTEKASAFGEYKEKLSVRVWRENCKELKKSYFCFLLQNSKLKYKMQDTSCIPWDSRS